MEIKDAACTSIPPKDGYPPTESTPREQGIPRPHPNGVQAAAAHRGQ